MINNSRQSFGHVLINHKGITIPTSVGSKSYESQFSGENSMINFEGTNGNIPNGYQHRPELISNLFMGGANSWWIVCERNGIFDVFEQLNSGDNIRLPTL